MTDIQRTPLPELDRDAAEAFWQRYLALVWHAMTDPEVARSHGFEPDDYVQIHDVATRLGDGWDVVVNEIRPRDLRSENSPHHEDTVLRAIRRA